MRPRQAWVLSYAASRHRVGDSARGAPDSVAIRVVIEDRGAAIPAGEDMIAPAGDVESWLAGHWGHAVSEVISQYACLALIRLRPQFDPTHIL